MQSDARREAGSMTTISANQRKYERLSSMISPLTKIGGVIPTITAQYYKNSLANFIRQDGLGATAVIEMEI